MILAEDKVNELFDEVFTLCEDALVEKEVPVACVFYNIKDNKIVAKAHNLTNKTKNATSHAEILCINYLTNEKYYKKDDFQNIIVVVSCEPCIMCAYALGLLNINSVLFGCYNEKFGGNGSVVSLNKITDSIKGYESKGGYFEDKFINILKNFYLLGNLNLPAEKRHRKIKEV